MLKHLAGLFVPHHRNNHKPRVLHISSLITLIALLAIVQNGITLTRRYAPDILGFASNISPSRVVELTNNERANAGLPPLVMDERLNDAARRKAADMFAKNYWAHVSPTGTKPWAFIMAAGYNYLHAGENLARDFSNPETAMAAWMASPTHKENIMSGRYQNIGIAVADGTLNGVETTLIVQMFGVLQSSTPQVNAASTVVKPVAAAAPTIVITNAPEPSPTPEEPVPVTPDVQQPTPAPESKMPAYDAMWVSKVMSLSFAILIMVVLAVDWLIVWRRNLVRLSGKSWAHLTYLAFILALTLIIRQGLIL
jgi:hypothetical protein